MSSRQRQGMIVLLFISIAMLFCVVVPGKVTYRQHQGEIFGTYFHITYSSANDLTDSINYQLQEFGKALNTFDSTSIISLVNSNKEVTTNALFEAMYTEAMKVSNLTHGAFDITVAPLVNVWGFGFKTEQFPTEAQIDSIKVFVGYNKVSLTNHHIYKLDQRLMLDAAAIAKGYSVDVVARMLERNECANYLVEIGGEIVCHGVNNQGKPWSIGINRPEDNPLPTNEVQQVVQSSDMAMATSGNYRQFYYRDGKRYSHTIDPRVGYPVNHNLLSATIVAPNCMEADALATACMVVGVDSAVMLCKSIDGVEGYFIYADGEEMRTIQTQGFEQYFKK